MINLHRLITKLFPDRRPYWEQKREREFIQAVNSLKTLRVTPEGGMSIDPEELREQIVASREQLKHFAHKPGAPSGSFNVEEHEASPAAVAPMRVMDCIEVVAWRRLHSGAAVRYVCLQCMFTGRYAVTTANLFSGALEILPSWVDNNNNRQIANALQVGELHWCATVTEAMDAWDMER